MFHLISHPCRSSCEVCTKIIFCAAGAVSKPKDTGWSKKWKRSDGNQKSGCCFFPQRFHYISKIIVIFQQFREALLTQHKLFEATPNYKPSVSLHFGDPEINVQWLTFLFWSRSDHEFAGGVHTPPSGQTLWCQIIFFTETKWMQAVSSLWFDILPTSVCIQINTTTEQRVCGPLL